LSAILGIDPGTQKCGYAVVGPGGATIERGIVPTGELYERLRSIVPQHGVRAIALGSGTNAGEVRAAIEKLGLPIALIDEHETTLHARARYFAVHPPTGWRRFVPRGMLLPPRPIDDFAAVLIAERFLADAAN
jgi:RNase H-fold protein (predicted Holliday junction resolvase)